jgi:hypothetical protein
MFDLPHPHQSNCEEALRLNVCKRHNSFCTKFLSSVAVSNPLVLRGHAVSPAMLSLLNSADI